MSRSNFTTAIRRFAAVGALSTVAVIGVTSTSAFAGDEHSGGVSPNSESSDPGAPAAVAASTAGTGGLPVTGGDVAGLVALGTMAVAAGAGALAVSKRRVHLSA